MLFNNLPVFTVVFLIIGLLLLKKFKNTGKIFILLSLIFALYLPVILGIFILSDYIYNDVYNISLLVLCVLLLTMLAGVLWGFIKNKKFYIPVIIVSFILLVTCGSFAGYEIYLSKIPKVSDIGRYEMLEKYSPYSENTKVASLEETSTLIIEDNLPRMDGATALYPVYSAFAKAVYPEKYFKSENDENEFYHDNKSGYEFLMCGSTSFAYENIVNGNADIIFVAAPSEKQEQLAKDNGVELVYTPIGKEAFVFFVNSKNPVDNLSLSKIQDIYSGKITSWSEFGADNLGKIKAFQREEGSGSQSALLRLMKGKNLIEAPREDIVDGMGGIINKTADYKNFKNAIGFSFRFYCNEMVKNDQIKLLKIDGVKPDIKNIENNKYPIASYFYAVTRSDASENTKKLVDWILSDQGQLLIEKTGYTSVR